MPARQAVPPTTLASTAHDAVDLALAAVLSDTAEACRRAEAMAQDARAAGDEGGEAMGRLILAFVELREGELAAGIDRLDEAQAALSRHSHARGELLARHVRTQALRRQGRNDDALGELTRLHALAAQRPPVDAFFTVMALGTVQGMLDHQDNSLASFYAGLTIARRTGLPSLEVNALNNLGSVQLDLYNLEDAQPLLRRCLELSLAIGSRRQRIFAAGNLLQCLSAMGLNDEALVLARTHLIPVIQPGDPPVLQRDEEIAQALVASGCFDEARQYLARAPQSDVLTNATTATRVWLEMQVMVADGRSAKALTWGLAHCGLTDDATVMPLDRIRLIEYTAECARRCGKWRTAYEHQHRAYALKDVLLGRAARARFLSLQIEHELARAQAERDDAFELAHQLERANLDLHAQVRANEVLRQQLESLALEDPLTGLCNRRALFQAGQAALDQARRTGSDVALALVDLDHFKAINDRHGHDAGDRVLQAFAEVARQAVRPGDVVCRYGGEEFVVVFAGASAQVAHERMNRVLAAFSGLTHEGTAGQAFGCTFSAGVAGTAGGVATLAELLQLADRALYVAKEAGRARIVDGTA
ncbi:GGDEF domain-containing protein [Ideonella sp. DXS29W]|uniref:diguanylate cyclase n=1 Tax=Ideonella lacteola TaxID=2984193 RepID=A0ABU9BXL9_9BURK